MRTLHDRSRRRITRWFVLGPLAALFLGGSAWAQVTGQLPELWQQAREWVVTLYAPSESALAVQQTGSGGRSSRAGSTSETPTPNVEALDDETLDDEALLDEELEALEEVDEGLEPPAVEEPPAPPASSPRIVSRVSPRAPSTSSSDVPREIPPDPELSMFREAHDRHFGGSQPAEAISAYRRYLEHYPSGRFVPEARYNTALNLLRLGQRERARELLEAFARGDYGGYRQQQANALLDASRREDAVRAEPAPSPER